MKGFIHYHNSQLAYEVIGSGPQVVLCFHGYAQDANVFRYFESSLASSCTLIAFDLFAHGQTQWNEPESCTAEQLNEIIEKVLQHLVLTLEKISLLTFSIGSLPALSLLRIAPEKFNRIILIAAPSDKFRKLVKFAVHTLLGKNICKFLLQFPGTLRSLNQLLHTLRLLPKPVFRFAQLFISDPEILKLVFVRWKMLGNLLTPVSKAVTSANKTGVEMILMSGKGDLITPPDAIQQSILKANHHRVVLLDQYHKLETEHVAKLLQEIFSKAN